MNHLLRCSDLLVSHTAEEPTGCKELFGTQVSARAAFTPQASVAVENEKKVLLHENFLLSQRVAELEAQLQAEKARGRALESQCSEFRRGIEALRETQQYFCASKAQKSLERIRGSVLRLEEMISDSIGWAYELVAAVLQTPLTYDSAAQTCFEANFSNMATQTIDKRVAEAGLQTDDSVACSAYFEEAGAFLKHSGLFAKNVSALEGNSYVSEPSFSCFEAQDAKSTLEESQLGVNASFACSALSAQYSVSLQFERQRRTAYCYIFKNRSAWSE